MKKTKGYLIQMPPGTVLSGLSGMVQAISLALPFCAGVGPGFRFESSGYTFFIGLPVLLSSSLTDGPDWIFLIVPLGTIVALLGLVRNYEKSIRNIRKYTLFIIPTSILSLACLAYLLFSHRWFTGLVGAWFSFVVGIPIFLGNILDLVGVRWSSFAGMWKGLGSTVQIRSRTILKQYRVLQSPLIRIGLAAILVCSITVLVLLLIDYAESRPFENPILKCPYLELGNEGLPYPVQLRTNWGTSHVHDADPVARMEDFCSRMHQRFAESNLTVIEANQFYHLLEDSNIAGLKLSNDDYGGLLVGEKPRPFDWRRQIMIKKISNEKYEVYYYRLTVCSVKHEYGEVYLKEAAVLEYALREAWSEQYCLPE